MKDRAKSVMADASQVASGPCLKLMQFNICRDTCFNISDKKQFIFQCLKLGCPVPGIGVSADGLRQPEKNIAASSEYLAKQT